MSNISQNTADLSPEQRRDLLAQQLRKKMNQTKVADQGKCVHQLFEAQVERTPDTVAVVFENQQMTYRELNVRANLLAHHLRALGVGSEVLVGLSVERSLLMVVGLLGILKAGGTYVPLDPTYPAERLRLMLAQTKVSVLLSQQHLVERLPEHNAQVICLDSHCEVIAQQSEENPARGATPENLAYVIYSSSRGVQVEHRGVGQRLSWLQKTFALCESDAVLHQAPLAQDTAVREIFWPLVVGGRLIIADANSPNDPVYLQRLIDRQKVSVIGFVPSALSAFVASSSGDKKTPLSSLRLVLCSGEPLRRSVVEAFRAHFTCKLHNLYSQPEAAGELTSNACQSLGTQEYLPIGHPTYMSVYVLDQYLQPVPVGVKGEIYVGGTVLARGYLQDEFETAQRFVKNPFSQTRDARLFKTGDWGRRQIDGTLELLGSSERQTWIKGYQVKLPEVEAALLVAPAVEDARVLVRHTETFEPQLVAYVVLSVAFNQEQLQSHLQALLPAYMIPCAYVPLSTLPLTPTGQVDEQALTRLPVIDSDLVQKWQEQLQKLPEIESVAVLVTQKTVHRSALHLQDLLPDGQTPAVPTIEASVTAPVARYHQLVDSEPQALAISDGGRLIIEEDAPKTLTDALLQTASKYPNKGIIYIQADGSQTIQTYEALLEEAKCILTGLDQMGFKAGDRAILQIQSLRDYFSTLWACLLGGITPVTVAVASSYDDKNAVVNKLFRTWELLGHPAILASDSLIEPIERLISFKEMALQVLPVSQLRNHSPSLLIHQSRPQEVAFFQLTSGSTGVPKCIQETHQGIITHIHAAQQFNGYQTGDVSLNWLPMDHVVPVLTCHFKDTYLGCQQVAVATDVILTNPLKWLDLIETYQVTHTWSPNFGFKLVSDALMKVQQKNWDLSSIKFLMNAGEQVTLPVVREFLELVAPFGVPTNAMQPAFGMAEICTCMTYQNHFANDSGVHRIQKSSLGEKLTKTNDANEGAIEFIDLGSPVPGVQIRITDQDNKVLPEGVIGRLQIKGDVVTPGYLNNEAANTEAFVGDGWFNSGDLGFIVDGRLTLTGREKELIIINGANYYCYEIEDTVNSIDGVEPTYVAACELNDPNRGTESLVIFFTPKPSGSEPNIELIKTIRTKVSSNLGIAPAFVIPVAKQEFPKTTSGKIQRAKLKNWLASGHFQDVLKEIDIHLENDKTLPDWFYRKIWHRFEARPNAPNLNQGTVLVFHDQLGLGTFLCGQMKQHNQISVSVETGSDFAQLSPNRYRLAPNKPDHYRRLLESLAADNIKIDQILHLWTYDLYAGEVSSLLDLEHAQEQGIYSLLFLVQALAKVQGSQHPVRLLVISSHTQAVSPNDKIAYEKATIMGLLKTIPQEMPWLSCCHVDLPPSSNVQCNGELIFTELRVLSKEKEVAYRDGQRWVCRLEKADLCVQPNLELPFQPGGMYLLSGGLGGIGIEIAKYLLEHYEAKLLLVGRTPLPERSTWDAYVQQRNSIAEKITAIQALEQFGGEILYHAVDICDLKQMQLVVEQAQSHWQCQLHGVIHLAGTYHESKLIEETKDTVSATLAPKVLGTWVLHQLLQDQPNSIFINFSSVNGFLGGSNVGAYAAANSFLDSFAQYQKYNTSLQSYCFAWSMWDETGISKGYQMKELTRARGYYIITAQQGLYSLLASLHHQPTQLVVGLDGSNRNLRRYMQSESYSIQKLAAYFTSNRNDSSLASFLELMVCDRFGAKSQSDFVPIEEMPLTDTGEIDREQLLTLGTPDRSGASLRVEPRTEIERQLASLWQQVLSVPVLGIHDNFFELGGHSLLATQVISRVQDVFELELPLRSLFENPTVAKLSIAIVETLTEKINDEILVQLKQLDDDQVKAMLETEMT